MSLLLPWRYWPLLAVIFLVAALGAFSIDLPVARWVRSTHGGVAFPGSGPDWRKPFDLAEVFGHRYGLALIGVSVWVLDPLSRRRVPRILTAAYFGGFTCDALKLIVARSRPYQAALEGSAFDSFVAWWPLNSSYFVDTPYGREFQAFPSGHAGAAVGLALALSTLYPRGTGWFLALAWMALTQRVLASQHFPSDVLVGGAVGALIAFATHHPSLAGHWFDRWEQRP